MNLVAQVLQVVGDEGTLSQVVPSFVPRQVQSVMAQAVAENIGEGGVLIAEAGTGVGKTYAYLVPALLSGERVMVATATKALQDQLFSRDIPRLLKALAVPVTVALLKGRGSYLCLHRLALARQDRSLTDSRAIYQLARVEEWAHETRSGDLAELPDLDEKSPLMHRITSTRENCLGSKCPVFRDCHVNLARRQAMAADLVVVNHHLFFADIAVRDSGVAELLPTVHVAIFDEAHQLNDIGVQFLGLNWSTTQVVDLARDLLTAGLQHARGLVDWNSLASDLEQAARELRLCLAALRAGSRVKWQGSSPYGVHPDDWATGLSNVRQACQHASEQTSIVTELAPDFIRLKERADQFVAHADRFLAPCPPQAVRWVEAGVRNPSPLRLIESPLDIASAFHAVRDQAKLEGERQRSWIFTSATLGHDDKLTWFTETCGLADARVLKLASPFDHEMQAALYVPSDLPKPSDPTHSQALGEIIVRAARELGGRTLVLTTTLKALGGIESILRQRVTSADILEVLVQGQLPKRQLMDRFRRAGSGDRPGAILVASASFWEGFDVPGTALQLVVLDKLPFPPPNDPLVEARTQRLDAAGRSSFKDYFLPEAAIALKQGIGRLIRHENDRGVVMIGDTRLTSMPYGKRLLKAMPAMRRLQTEDELMQELQLLRSAIPLLPELPPGVA